MSTKQIRRFEYESDTWKRQLSFIMEENIYLKKGKMGSIVFTVEFLRVSDLTW